MTGTPRSDPALFEFVEIYALDALTATEREGVERRRARADRCTAAEFDAAVAAVHEVLARLSVPISRPPPAELEHRLLTAAVIDAQPDSCTRCASAGSGGRLEVRASAELCVAAVIVDGFPESSRGAAYQIWSQPIGAAPGSVAVFDGPRRRAFVTGLEPPGAVVITVEPSGGSPEPSSAPIACIDLA